MTSRVTRVSRAATLLRDVQEDTYSYYQVALLDCVALLLDHLLTDIEQECGYD